MTIIGLACVPALGLGLILLAWNFFISRRQRLFVSSGQAWFHSGNIGSPTYTFYRREITRLQMRQSWLQQILGTGDLIIHSPQLPHPIVARGLADVHIVRQRLSKHLRTERVHQQQHAKPAVTTSYEDVEPAMSHNAPDDTAVREAA